MMRGANTGKMLVRLAPEAAASPEAAPSPEPAAAQAAVLPTDAR
ncbi:hypothetical protein ACODT5_35340 [Streptomyces sp. 5.8]